MRAISRAWCKFSCPARQWSLGTPKRFTAAALGAEVDERGIAAVDGDAESHGECSFQRRKVEVGLVRRRDVGDFGLYSFDQCGATENVRGEFCRPMHH